MPVDEVEARVLPSHHVDAHGAKDWVLTSHCLLIL